MEKVVEILMEKEEEKEEEMVREKEMCLSAHLRHLRIVSTNS